MHVRHPIVAALAVMSSALLAPLISHAQAAGYDRVVAQAHAALSAGRPSAALAASKRAIRLAPNRWEAYMVAGGALELQRQYDQAIEVFTKALERSPDAKKPAIRAILAKCLREETAATSVPAARPAEADSGAVTQGPTFNETLDWLVSKNSQEGYGYKQVMVQHYSNPDAAADEPNETDYSYHAAFGPSADGAECEAQITYQSPNMNYGDPILIHFSALAPGSVAMKPLDVQQEAGAGTSVTDNGPNDILGPTTTTVTTVTPNEAAYFEITGLHPYVKGYGQAAWDLGDDKNGAFFRLVYSDRELATRVVNALNHAIAVCGGKGKPAAF